MSQRVSKETLRRRVADLEARAALKPLGPMAQADLDHARAALASFGSDTRLAAAAEPTGPQAERYAKATAPYRKRPHQAWVRSVVSAGLPGLGKKSH